MTTKTKRNLAIIAVVAFVVVGAGVRISEYSLNRTMVDRYVFVVEDPLVTNYKVPYSDLKTNILNGVASGALALPLGSFLTNIVIFTDQYRTQAVTISGTTISITNQLGGVYFYGGTLALSNIQAGELDVTDFWPTNINQIISAWAGPSNTFTFGPTVQEYTTTTDCALTNFANVGALGTANSAILSITNSGSSDRVFYATAANLTTDDGLRAYTITNHSARKFSLNHDNQGYHLVSRPFQ